jgi:hypothetical protein
VHRTAPCAPDAPCEPSAPFDLFNITNSNAAETRTVSTGTSFLRPTAVLAPRTARLGARLSW